jgi:hypothetical protein
MNEIHRQVARVRCRLIVTEFLNRLAQSFLATFIVALIGLAVPKWWHLEVDPMVWVMSWLFGAAIIGMLSAFWLTWLHAPTSVQAAAELDKRLNLRERLGSTLQLDVETRESPIGQALLEDASRIAERIDVRDAFAVRFGRAQLAQLLPMVLAGLILLLPNAQPVSGATAGLTSAAVNQVKNSARDLKEQIQKQREQAEENGLKDAADFLKQLENKIDDFQKTKANDPKKILSDLNQLKESLEKRRQDLGSSEDLRKKMSGMKSMEQGPAEKLAKSMQEGDFEKASSEIEKMMKEIQSGDMSAETQQKLAEQLDKMAEAFEKSVAEHQAEARELEKKIAEAQASSDANRVAELREKLAENQAQDKAMEELRQMAQDMKECKECLGKGNKQSTEQALSKLKKQLDKMNEADKQMQDLDKLVKGAEQCKRCANGQCDGNGEGKSKSEQEDWSWKRGMGEGRGAGPRPESETDTRTVDSQVRTDMKQGETVYGGKTGGDNKKGVSREEVKQAILSAEIEDPEALDNLPLPKKQREQAREYYDSLRGKSSP